MNVFVLYHMVFFGNDLNFMMFCAIRCEAFSTYPRTYDLLHADGFFTAESHR